MQDERARPAEPSVCVDSQHCYFSTFGVGAMMGIDLCPHRGGQVGAAGNRQRKRDQITPPSGPRLLRSTRRISRDSTTVVRFVTTHHVISMTINLRNLT